MNPISIPCPYCGASIEQTAVVCPSCRAKRTPAEPEDRSGGGLWIVLAILGAGLLGVVLKLGGFLG